ncbi:MAG: hypothetical protein U1F34_02575 [Gammaproteobacteria bacterium]
MDALLILIKILVLVFAASVLAGGGICTAGSAVYIISEPVAGLMMLGISLLFAVPSFFVTRAMWRSLTRKPGLGATSTIQSQSANDVGFQLAASVEERCSTTSDPPNGSG